METKISLMLTITVSLILAGALLVPIISDVTATHDTFENDGYFSMMDYYDTSDDVTVSWDYTDPTNITVGTETYELDTPTNQFISIVVGDDFYVRYANGGSNHYIQASYGGTDKLSASTAASSSFTATFSGGTATMTVGSTSQTADYTEIYVISGDDGDYVMKYSDDTAYMGAETEFCGVGVTALGDATSVIRVEGTIEDGATVTVIAATTTDTPTISNVVVNATEIDGYDGYELSSITFTISADGEDYDATYSYFIVPSEVSLEKSEHMGTTEIALISVIPIMVILAVLMVAVRGITRND